MNEIANQQTGHLAMSESAVIDVLRNSIYPGAQNASIHMVLEYCKAAGLDPMQKPVHIVPMWDRASGGMRDVIMPGVGLYRTQAARTGQFAGMTEPEFGPEMVSNLGGQEIRFPEWAKVTVKRALINGVVAEFTAVEYWVENYAVKGGKEKSIAPNAMWMKRPRGQIAKCAAAQALRIAFPELGAQATAEEMEGKPFDSNCPQSDDSSKPTGIDPQPVIDGVRAMASVEALNTYWAENNGALANDLTAHGLLKAACQSHKKRLQAEAAKSEVTDVEVKDAVA